MEGTKGYICIVYRSSTQKCQTFPFTQPNVDEGLGTVCYFMASWFHDIYIYCINGYYAWK